ncbi:MAG: ATPase, partial [Flammeovirgaceae bacterium]
NELPTRGDGLEALWDRFLIRYLIEEIKEKGNFLNMITNTNDVYTDHVAEELKITDTELDQWANQINQIELPKEVLNTIQVVKHKIEAYDSRSDTPFKIYDRRWKKVVHLLRTSAFLNGRTEVDLMDCFLMVHCLWSTPLHQDALKEIVAETIRKYGYSIAMNLSNLRKEIEAFEEEVQQETQIPNTITREEAYLIERKYYEVLYIGNIMDGKYIKASDFERLQLEEETTIGLYDENYKLTYKIRTHKSKEENEVLITHNAQQLTFQLKTQKREITEYLTKKPHPIIIKFWNERFDTLFNYIQQLQQKTEEERPKQLANLQTNRFVPPTLAKIVEANLIESLNTLNGLALRVEKIRHNYMAII